jgi:hypothetical protein
MKISQCLAAEANLMIIKSKNAIKDMSTLEYLDPDGTVNFLFVPWNVMNKWLSALNGVPNVAGWLRNGVNRGQAIAELEKRRAQQRTVVDMALRATGRDRGYGQDWREYENDEGYNHLEELLMYQPADWRLQAREYIFLYQWDLARVSIATNDRRTVSTSALSDDSEGTALEMNIPMTSTVLVVLFHPEILRTKRYEPLNFLLAYGVEDPLPRLFEELGEELNSTAREAILAELSPLDYFLEFHKHVQANSLDKLRNVGEQNAFPRLPIIKEFDFANIIGQRLAKQMIREEVIDHIWNRCNDKGEMCSSKRQPLSMIFAGSSGIGKTELAEWLAKLMNAPGEDAFLKVDCGQLTDGRELFGMSGPFQGAEEGSALNNFMLRMASTKTALGIVLLDEIEKADSSVIRGLYQVLDKGEWTNKKLVRGNGTQTDTIRCDNIIFIMTTNAADKMIGQSAAKSDKYYTAGASNGDDEMDDVMSRSWN